MLMKQPKEMKVKALGISRTIPKKIRGSIDHLPNGLMRKHLLGWTHKGKMFIS